MPFGSDAVEAGWLESWSQLVGFVLSVFGITRSLAFMSEEQSYAALYASLKQFNLFTLCPLLGLLQDVINMQLVEPYWGPEYIVELTPKKITDDDLKERQLATDIQAGARKVGEMRALRGLPPSDRDKEWVGVQKPNAPVGAFGTEERRQQALEASRPRNAEGRDSLGSREGAKSRSLLALLESRNGLLNGHGKHN